VAVWQQEKLLISSAYCFDSYCVFGRKKMRVLILGGTGQLGRGIIRHLTNSGTIDFTETDFQGVTNVKVVARSVDITDPRALRIAITDFQPDWVINAAAYTQVDAAELAPFQAIATNAGGAANVALCSKDVGARLIYFSTESVFDGRSVVPYSESNVCNPLSVYSISKRAGEELATEICESSYVLRTSWLYGDSTTSNFPARLLANLFASEGPVPVVTDLVGNPTPVTLLAEATLAIMQSPPEVGTYHVCTTGSATKNEWARAIAQSQGFSPKRIVAAKSSDFPNYAQRSQNVVLSCEKFLSTGLMVLPNWGDYYPALEVMP
jgi:dTDP-4-dehydrorhamnose reductase